MVEDFRVFPARGTFIVCAGYHWSNWLWMMKSATSTTYRSLLSYGWMSPKEYAITYSGSVYINSRVWINLVRLPILLVVSSTGKTNISLPVSPSFAHENLVSRDAFGSVSRQPAHSPNSGWIWCLLTRSLPIYVRRSMCLLISTRVILLIDWIPDVKIHPVVTW